MKTVHINLGHHHYDIVIGQGLLSDHQLIASMVDSQQVCIVTNAVIAEHYLSTLLSSLSSLSLTLETVILPEGESNKTQTTLDLIHNRLIEKKFSRDCLLIALGGGIVGDIAGFAAASYQRGVKYLQIPTTLLAQVDSSVGGKTGINHALGKNLIGAFHQPVGVIIDTNVLATLPPREIAAGMAEVIKYGLIRDRQFLDSLQKNLDSLMTLDHDKLAEVIQRSCQHKANVVENDEKEQGERATLNLGHTFGHAIEALTHYHTYLHGEAIAIGTMMAAELSRLLGWLSDEDVVFIERLFIHAKCPTTLREDLSATAIRQAMQRDKKVAAGKLRLILLSQLGQAVIRDDIDEALILRAIEARLAAQ